MTRIKVSLVFLTLFAISVAVRQPLFNKDFSSSFEWLAAHTLMTEQLWDATPESIHHFNLLYTFPNPESKFIDNLWNSGVADARGNYYYVSMPHLAFLTPYVFLKLFRMGLTPKSLQQFTLAVHLLLCGLTYVLARRLTPKSRFAPLAAVSVILFAPTALFYYQNAVVGTVLVIPYTIAALWAADALLGPDETRRSLAWLVLGAALLLGCLTDWQSYFTAFATAAVAVLIAIRTPQSRTQALTVTALCCVAVALAVTLIALQDSRISGLEPFVRTILGRLKVRSGLTGEGFGLTDRGYYHNMARFYGSYLPFILLGAATAFATWRTHREIAIRTFRRGWIVLSISTLAVLSDHVVLPHHTSQQSFTTLNGLVPIAALAALGVGAFLETQDATRGASPKGTGIVVAALALCIGLSVAEYYVAYANRARPFRAAANRILEFAQPSDVIFAAGAGFDMGHDDVIPQMLYYLKRNVQVVRTEAEARRYLTGRGFNRGVLAKIDNDRNVVSVAVVKRF